MTDETKKLFDAPWRIHKTYPNFVMNSNNLIVAECRQKTANRIARLPELYDALMYLVVNYCHEAFLSCDECRLCPDQNCKGRKWVELLRKVRDGE